LYEVLHACDQSDDTRVFVITGEGRGFSAGADLKDRGGSNESASNAPTLGERLYQALVDIEKPVIAAINGVAVGGGCTLTLLCDIRVAAESAKFQLPFTKLGLSAELGSTYLLPRLLGMGKAMELILTSKMIDAEEALDIGLVNQVVADDELLRVAATMAGQIAAFPPASVRMNKAGLKLGADMAGQFRYENMALDILHKTDDAKEAAAAFREKRDPVFTGR
jgi:enoyl-CoA hydratase